MVRERSGEVCDFATGEWVVRPERSHKVAERDERCLPGDEDGSTTGDGEPFETVGVGSVVPGHEDIGADELFLQGEVVVADAR